MWLPALTLIAAITGGTADDADPAVVAIVAAGGRIVCTGVLVAPRVVVTAAHCADGALPEAVVAGGETLPVVDAATAPGFDPSLADDVGVFILGAPSAVTPLVLGGGVNAGDTVRIVGYGRAGPDDDGQAKRTGTAIVTSVDDTSFRMAPGPSLVCRGDSGGPALLGDVVVGITSSGDVDCQDFGRDMRVDAFADFIAAFRPGAAGDGERCRYDENCARGVCAAAPDTERRYCSSACGDGCPAGMTCESGSCAYPLPSPGALGSACRVSEDCDSSFCDGRVCSKLCFAADDEPCPTGFACVANAALDGLSTCVADSPPAGCSVAASGDGASLVVVLGAFLQRRRLMRGAAARA